MEKVCERCGKIYDGTYWQLYCDECRKIVKSKQVHERTCIDCGSVYMGPPSMKRCPSCSERHAKENMKQKHRKIGDTATCEGCGKLYTIESSNSKYCTKECREDATKRRQRERRRIRYSNDKEKFKNIRYEQNEKIKEVKRVCGYCGKTFIKGKEGYTLYCSDYCRGEANRISIAKNSGRNLEPLFTKREEYRKKVQEEIQNEKNLGKNA